MCNQAVMLRTNVWYSGDPLFFFFCLTTHVTEFQCNEPRSNQHQYLDFLLRWECLSCFSWAQFFPMRLYTYMNLFIHLLYMSRLLESIALVEISITFQSFKLNAHLLVCLVDNSIFTIFWWWFAAILTHIGGGVCWPKKLCGFNWIYRCILALS